MHRERNERRTFGQVKNDEQEKVVSFVDIWSAEKCGTVPVVPYIKLPAFQSRRRSSIVLRIATRKNTERKVFRL
jgi:hypothetical protein